MRERPSVSSFEPTRLREAARKLQRQLRELERRRQAPAAPPPQVDGERPGILRRWWRALFGA